MNMNVEDKLAWLKDSYRVLKPGGRAVLYEVWGHKNTPLYFPVPWAQDNSMSFLVPPELFRDLITLVVLTFKYGMTRRFWHRKLLQMRKNPWKSQVYRLWACIFWWGTTSRLKPIICIEIWMRNVSA